MPGKKKPAPRGYKTVEEVAKKTGLNPATIRNRYAAGELKGKEEPSSGSAGYRILIKTASARSLSGKVERAKKAKRKLKGGYSVSELADAAGVEKTAVTLACREGRLKGAKKIKHVEKGGVGGHWRIPKKAGDAYTRAIQAREEALAAKAAMPEPEPRYQKPGHHTIGQVHRKLRSERIRIHKTTLHSWVRRELITPALVEDGVNYFSGRQLPTLRRLAKQTKPPSRPPKGRIFASQLAKEIGSKEKYIRELVGRGKIKGKTEVWGNYAVCTITRGEASRYKRRIEADKAEAEAKKAARARWEATAKTRRQVRELRGEKRKRERRLRPLGKRLDRGIAAILRTQRRELEAAAAKLDKGMGKRLKEGTGRVAALERGLRRVKGQAERAAGKRAKPPGPTPRSAEAYRKLMAVRTRTMHASDLLTMERLLSEVQKQHGVLVELDSVGSWIEDGSLEGLFRKEREGVYLFHPETVKIIGLGLGRR